MASHDDKKYAYEDQYSSASCIQDTNAFSFKQQPLLPDLSEQPIASDAFLQLYYPVTAPNLPTFHTVQKHYIRAVNYQSCRQTKFWTRKHDTVWR